eukprot:353546-Chlamydomonas_euryale.AAC.1
MLDPARCHLIPRSLNEALLYSQDAAAGQRVTLGEQHEEILQSYSELDVCVYMAGQVAYLG